MVSIPPESTAPGGAEVDAWEREAIRETQRGRPEAFNPLVSHYAPRIRAYLFRMVRNREEAEDLTQETFIKAFRALSRFQSDRAFRSWLYAIATNTGLNALRSRRRRGTPAAIDLEQLPAPGSPASPSGHSLSDAREIALANAMAALEPRAARLIALHYQEGLTLAEAGEVLELSANAAKVALHRARKQLREHMVKGSENE